MGIQLQQHLRARRSIGEKVNTLRRGRRWSQAELSKRLGVSQASVSNVERGSASLTAEQFLEVLRLFNVSAAEFVPPRPDKRLVALQNALARHGANHLRESEQVVVPERYRQVTVVVRDALVEGDPRLLAALAPVLVENVDRLNLRKLEFELSAAGFERRLWWVVECVLGAVEEELSSSGVGQPSSSVGQPSSSVGQTGRQLRRARVVLEGYLEHIHQTRDPADYPLLDLLDPSIRSKRSVKALVAASGKSARRWRIVSSLQPADFLAALQAASADD